MLNDLKILKRQNENDKKGIEKMIRQRELLTKECAREENDTRSAEESKKMKTNEKKKIENEIEGSRNEAAKIQNLISGLERDKEKYAVESLNANARYYQSLEEVKLKTAQINVLQKKNQQAEAKLKQQQNLYEVMRSDLNLYSKNLLESNDELADLRRKFKILDHQIKALHEEIDSKKNMLKNEMLTRKSLEEANKTYEAQKERKGKIKDNLEKRILNNETEISQLKSLIAQAEQERAKQKKEHEMVINDRDILSTQLIRRNEELASLYEKIKIQQSTLAKGEVQYQERVLDVTLLKNKISKNKTEHIKARSQVSCIPDLKREVYQLKRELLECQTKVKGLQEELKNPMNVHRYRKLEGTDPETYEMIMKIQTLQRRLIAKTEEVSEKEFLIKEKEKLYIELKNILARQPGPEVAEQLAIYQENLKDKTKQMRTMSQELSMYQAQVNEYKYDIERIGKEIQNVKNKWFSMMRDQRNYRAMSEVAEHPDEQLADF